MKSKIKRIVLTGGPGVGKTSIVRELERLGYDVREEIFTEIFKRAEDGGYFNDEYLKSRELLQELIQTQKILEVQKANGSTIFFDRSRVDISGFCTNLGIVPEAEDVRWFSQNEYDLVFIVEPLPAQFYDQNSVRRQSQEESLEHHKNLVRYYEEFASINRLRVKDFIVRVPYFSGSLFNSVRSRTQFILNSIEEANHRDSNDFHMVQILNLLSQEMNAMYGFVQIEGENFGEPGINSGPCGAFAHTFYQLWNSRFERKVSIAFVMLKNSQECWHVLIRLPNGLLFDGGNGVHTEERYREFIVEDMLTYDLELLDKRSYGLDRDYPRFCPNFNLAAVSKVIENYLSKIPNMKEQAHEH